MVTCIDCILFLEKVQLSVQDIETILNTLIYDGKAETTVVVDNRSSSSGQKTLYRAVLPIIASTGLMRTPCGVCPVSIDIFSICIKRNTLWTDLFFQQGGGEK